MKLRAKINTATIDFIDDYGLRIDDEEGENIFVGWLPDQCALLGLLNRLNEISYEMISVEIFAPNESTLMT